MMLALLTSLIASLPAAPVTADDAPKKDALKPEQILAQAKQRQGGANLSEIKDFFASNVKVELRDEKGNVNVTDVDRRFATDGRIWTRIRESLSDGDFQEGFDGKKYWHYDTNKKREIDITSNAEYATARKKLKEEMDQMRLLAKVFLIQSLAQEMTGIASLPDENKNGLEAYVLVGDGNLAEPGREKIAAKITLWFAKKKCGSDGPEPFDLLGARIARNDGSPTDTLCFWYHSRTPQGVVLPGRVQMFRGSEEKPYLTLGFSEKETQRIKFNNGFKDGDFGPQS